MSPPRPRHARARQHGTVPPRYPPADSRPRAEAGGEARASPRFLSLPTAAPVPTGPTDHDPGGPGETSSAQQALRERGASERSPSLDLGGRRPSDNDDDAGLAGKRSPAAAAAHSGPARHPSRAVTAAAARSGDPAGD